MYMYISNLCSRLKQPLTVTGRARDWTGQRRQRRRSTSGNALSPRRLLPPRHGIAGNTLNPQP